MSDNKQTAIATTRDPFAILRQMTAELDRSFGEWPTFRFPLFARTGAMETGWSPKIDVFERDNRLVTKVDLPGMKKEDVTVEVTDGHLTMSGERKQEKEERDKNVYRTEREYGSFYRTVPLPEGVKLEDVKATFSDGVLEVSVPLPTARAEAAPRKVQIETPAAGASGAKTAA